MIKWIFFDVGNVLLNDDPVMAVVFRHLWESLRAKGLRLTFEDLMREREELSNQGPRLRIHHELALRYLTLEEWKRTRRAYLDESLPNLLALCPPIPGMARVVQQLKDKARLGMIANQPDDIIPVLEHHGLWEPFEVKGISQVVGISKPDPDFYRWALRCAGCRAREAVMVGDTIKYDIRPARLVGMRTVWFNAAPREKGYKPRNEFEEIYLRSLQRQLRSRRKKVRQEVRPDAIARNSRELLRVLLSLIDSR